MISILIPTYNYNVFPLVENLQKQSDGLNIAYEILVLDDASTEKKIVEKNSEINSMGNCRFEVLPKNIGRSKIRNLLAEKAKFDWLLFLDADVLPKTANFMKEYTLVIEKHKCQVIYGGIVYQQEKPTDNKMLRWKYGKEREAKSVLDRQKDPYFIISQNLFIKKTTFLKANSFTENYYGLDNFFSNQLKKMNAVVLHIYNPVIHFGLEENERFIKKALNAVETTVILEAKGLMDKDMRPIQKSYIKLDRFHLEGVFSFVISNFKTTMERNFNSPNPNLFWFDLYRLNYYIKFKKKYNA